MLACRKIADTGDAIQGIDILQSKINFTGDAIQGIDVIQSKMYFVVSPLFSASFVREVCSPILSVDGPPIAAASAEKEDRGDVIRTSAFPINIISTRAT